MGCMGVLRKMTVAQALSSVREELKLLVCMKVFAFPIISTEELRSSFLFQNSLGIV